MGQISYNCPHIDCRVKNSTFNTHISVISYVPRKGNLFGTCSQCGEGVVFYISTRSRVSIDKAKDVSGKLFSSSFIIESIAPEPPSIETVEHLETEISTTYLEAEDNYTDARYRSAAAMYRTTVELSVKHLDPEGNGSLYKRIEAMADKNA